MDLIFKLILASAFMGHAKVHSAPRLPRLSVAESMPSNYFYNNIGGQPGVYSFNYDVSDYATGNTQYRTEDRFANGTVTGAYGYIDAFGTPQRFRYVADQTGYRVFREAYFKPNCGYQTTTLKPIDKIVVQPTETSITWTRPKRPSKNKNSIEFNRLGDENSSGHRRHNLIGSPSLYAAYD